MIVYLPIKTMNDLDELIKFSTQTTSRNPRAPRQGTRWTKHEDLILSIEFSSNKDIHSMAAFHRRSYKGIVYRLLALNLQRLPPDHIIERENSRYLR